MALHPIRALDHVVEEYRDYLRTEFRAKDPALKAALERELDRPLFLVQEPFFQAHRPFKAGAAWADLPLDARLATAMEQRTGNPRAFLHQADAIQHLLSPAASPLVVTTGTGSGKTEAFLLPVIQNAIADAVAHKHAGLTAILVYPMNALANDQLLRIKEYLKESGWAGAVQVAKYDRGTSQEQRQKLRSEPPHILLTNYMMLEYLLVRPTDRDGIFANHRCHFLVLDEVHTYRGTLGTNIAMLIRRLGAHLRRARQDWRTDVSPADQPRRYPALIPVGTSATIKTVDEDANTEPAKARQQRDLAVQDFFGKLTGVPPASIKVLGEELEELPVPTTASYPATPATLGSVDISNPEMVRRALCRLAGVAETLSVADAANRCRLLWDLNHWLIRQPLSTSELVARVRAEVPERATTDESAVCREVEAALAIGAALPDKTPGALRLRVHRFIRGGWQFHRCVNPACGKIFPLGEEKCNACNYFTAPLHLCRNCGAHYLRFIGDKEDVAVLTPSAVAAGGPEWMLYEHGRFTQPDNGDDDDNSPDDDEPTSTHKKKAKAPTQLKKRPILDGSFDPSTLAFSLNPAAYSLRVKLSPARTRCLQCGGTSGSRNVITPVALGTSAAVKVLSEGLVEALAEANQDKPGHDGKERLLVFSDSRQDAAHQARFIIFASRYDRLRRRMVELLDAHGAVSLQKAVELLGDQGVAQRDNPYAPEDANAWLTEEQLARVRAWEEAPLLDDISVNAGYRATAVNLGLVGVVYDHLDEHVRKQGGDLAKLLGITTDQLFHLCRCVLDEVRVRGCISRDLLRYHPRNPAYPKAFLAAQWERQVRKPQGFAANREGDPVANLQASDVPDGIHAHNLWRRPKGGGAAPRVERIIRHLVQAMGGRDDLDQSDGLAIVKFMHKRFLVTEDLLGPRSKARLLQVNAEVVRLVKVTEASRRRCTVCSLVLPFSILGAPCPKCHGKMGEWTDADVAENRTVRRLRSKSVVALVAAEHTAQVPNDARVKLEEEFKAGDAISKRNLLACSPTLEMGIDVGGLDAVVLRNVPPRPDNYAQRGGRAGRRSRVGLVVGYARSTPHDQYFYDQPAEMISGQVPAPALSLGNRDVILRHINAILFGAAEPGLAGRMVQYVSPDGEIQEERVQELLSSLQAKAEQARQLAHEAFGVPALTAAGLDDATIDLHLAALPANIRELFNRSCRQVIELRKPLDKYYRELTGGSAGHRAGDLVARMLGIPLDTRKGDKDADDRSAGYPLRRFAEFGILPGYEFPSEPATLRLLGDEREDEAISVERRLGIAQFQPDAQVFARTRRWRTIGLDRASPWNPQSQVPGWLYRRCGTCDLRYTSDQPRCPRCLVAAPGTPLPGFEYGGFLARRDEGPILDEEERYATKNLVTVHPQWDGAVIARWRVGERWHLRLSHNEEVRWINENRPPTDAESKDGRPMLHNKGKGYLLCGHCGHILQPPVAEPKATGRRRARTDADAEDLYGHGPQCPQANQPPKPVAIVAAAKAEVLRLIVPAPANTTADDVASWGYSLGYSLLAGIRHLYMLDGSEIDFQFEGPWPCDHAGVAYSSVALTFVDPSLGGSGYLHRVATDLHLVAARALQHLAHPGCETACYRCLKAYDNQRVHDKLVWPLVAPDLEQLAALSTTTVLVSAADIDDPMPWLEAYKAGVGSPLELKFMRLFEAHGFSPMRQVPIAAVDGAPPITIPDFAVPAKRLAIYVDGAAFHSGNNMRRDRQIRDRLRAATPPWRVVELNAKDLARGAALVAELRALV